MGRVSDDRLRDMGLAKSVRGILLIDKQWRAGKRVRVGEWATRRVVSRYLQLGGDWGTLAHMVNATTLEVQGWAHGACYDGWASETVAGM